MGKSENSTVFEKKNITMYLVHWKLVNLKVVSTFKGRKKCPKLWNSRDNFMYLQKGKLNQYSYYKLINTRRSPDNT